ncbi:MAG: protoporphyrinogen oxidase [Kurthia sp.]|nr:protoporphyrinogen oxidase [Candidatus Kurthia equi]
MKRVVVIGGGITGMSTMHYLQRQAQQQGLDIDLTLVEKGEKLGGKMVTREKEGFIMEVGADSIVARHTSVKPLIEELDLTDRVVYNGTGVSYILRDNELHAIPVESVFGIPMNKESLATSTLLSEEGKRAVEKDLTITDIPFTNESSVGEFLTYYLGSEIVEKQIAPVLSGVYSGDLNKLTIGATLPYLLQYKKEFGSLMKGFEANKESFQKNATKKFISFENGLAELFDRMEERLHQATILKGVSVTKLKKQDSQYMLQLDSGEKVVADYVVLTTPHRAAQQMLSNEALNPSFDALQTGSIITVYLAYDLPNETLPADGTGFIVSKGNNVDCNACTWTSKKWQHTSKNNQLLIRMFYKKNNPRFEEFRQMSDEELVEVARNDVKKSLNIEQQPLFVDIEKWFDLMPIYNLQHKQAIEQLETVMEQQYPNLYLAGSSYYGVGIGLCIENGKQVANKILEVVPV